MLARFIAALAASASCSTPPASVEPPPRRPVETAAPAIAQPDAASPSTMDAAARPVLDAADCRALASAPALAIATVASSKADCSGIGNTYVVFDVVRLVRGENIARVVIRRPLYDAGRTQISVGDTFVVAIEPGVRPARTVQCVPIPAHEGSARHIVRAASAMDAEHLVEATSSCP